MHAFLHCLSKLHNEIGAIDVNQRSLVQLNQISVRSRLFLLILFEVRPFIFIKLFITYNFTALFLNTKTINWCMSSLESLES